MNKCRSCGPVRKRLASAVVSEPVSRGANVGQDHGSWPSLSELKAITDATKFRRLAVSLGLTVNVRTVGGTKWGRRSKPAILDDFKEKLKELQGSTACAPALRRSVSELKAMFNPSEFRRRAASLGLTVRVQKVGGKERVWRSKGAILDDYREKLKELQGSTA